MNITRFPRINNSDNFRYDRFCYDDCIATVISSYNLYFQYLYVDIYETIFDKRGVTTEAKITTNLKKILNITKEQIDGKSASLLQSIIYYVSNAIPIIAIMDGYYCPWDWRFLEIHGGEHAFIIYDYFDGKFCCVDPFYKKELVYLNLDYFSKGCYNIDLFRLEDTLCSFCEKDLNSIFYTNMEVNLSYKFLNRSIKYFVNCIERCDYLEAIGLLENIIDNRIRYASYIDFMISREYIKKEFLIICRNIIQRWEVLHAMVLKAIYGGSQDSRRLENMYSNILYDERCLQLT